MSFKISNDVLQTLEAMHDKLSRLECNLGMKHNDTYQHRSPVQHPDQHPAHSAHSMHPVPHHTGATVVKVWTVYHSAHMDPHDKRRAAESGARSGMYMRLLHHVNGAYTLECGYARDHYTMTTNAFWNPNKELNHAIDSLHLVIQGRYAGAGAVMPTDRIVIHFSDGEHIAFRPK